MIHWLIESAQDLQEKPEWFLSKAEQEKYATFQIEKRRDEWLLGRWTAKRLVQARLLDQDPHMVALDALEIFNDADGVPHVRDLRGLQDLKGLNVSISHSHEHALCAVSTRRVGADLEFVEPRDENLVNDYFTANEIARVKESSPETRDIVINALWSAKEAALKALHKGLSVDTRAVEISLAPFENAPETWTPFQIRITDDTVSSAPLRGWWRVFDGFVLTLAANVQELPDAAELLPETFLVAHAPAPHAHTTQRIGHPPHHPTNHTHGAHTKG